MIAPLIVLGAGGCIGRRVVAAALDAGRPVIAAGRDAVDLQALHGHAAAADLLVTLPVDIASESAAAAFAESVQALAGAGGIAGMVAAVGAEGIRGRVLDQPADFLRRCLDDELMPHLFAARHLLPMLAGHARGTYVLVGGPGAEQPWAGYGHRSIAAAALRMLARVLHDEARTLPARVQLLAVDAPARTEANAKHACAQWPSADAIARRALALAVGRDPAAAAIVRIGRAEAGDRSAAMPGHQGAPTADTAATPDAARPVAAHDDLSDARSLLRGIAARFPHPELPAP